MQAACLHCLDGSVEVSGGALQKENWLVLVVEDGLRWGHGSLVNYKLAELESNL
jgi:hypothetical protein